LVDILNRFQKRKRGATGEVRDAGELQFRGARSICCKIEQDKRIRRSARAREGDWEKEEGAGMVDRAGIVDDWRRCLQVFDEEFVGLERFPREERKEKEEGVREAFIAGLAWRGS
jgi:hypothetical protein